MTTSIKDLTTAVRVNWNMDVANEPKLELVVSAVPRVSEDTVWSNVPNQDGGHALLTEIIPGAYHFHSARPMAEQGTDKRLLGCAGHGYEFTLTDGTKFKSNDVWSSNADHINDVFNRTGDDRLIEVSYIIIESWGRQPWAGVITVGLYKEICAHIGVYFNEENQCPSASADKRSKRISLEQLQHDLKCVQSWEEDSRFCKKHDKQEAIAKCEARIAAAQQQGYAVVNMKR